jgi:ABC-type cobalamin/Fe3+-siderophores transport system ATPase subunit
MIKNNVALEYEEELDDFDFIDELEPHNDAIADMMNSMVAASKSQQLVTMELTRLVVERSTSENLTEEHIFSTFQRASKVVAESFPLKELWEKLN